MLFPLTKDCSTVGASSLPQCKAADEPKRKQDDGQEDAQAGEAVLQDTNPAERGSQVRTPKPDNPWDISSPTVSHPLTHIYIGLLPDLKEQARRHAPAHKPATAQGWATLNWLKPV